MGITSNEDLIIPISYNITIFLIHIICRATGYVRLIPIRVIYEFVRRHCLPIDILCKLVSKI